MNSPLPEKDRFKYTIFDLDGTLAAFPIDYAAARAELNALFSNYSLSSPFRPLIPEIRRLAGLAGSPGLVRESFAILDRHELASVIKAIPLEPVLKLYRDLTAAGAGTAILTRNGSKLVHAFLSRLSLPPPAVSCSRDECVNLKPDPEQGLYVLERLGAAATDCVLIGDSYHDEELAKRLGMTFRHVSRIS